MINFIGEGPGSALVGASDQTVYHLSKWYKSNTLNFISKTHHVWDPDRQRKPSKRYGTLIESSQVGVNDMLTEHQEDVEGWILKRVIAAGGS